MAIRLRNVPTIVVSSPERQSYFLRPTMLFSPVGLNSNLLIMFPIVTKAWFLHHTGHTGAQRREVESLVDQINRAVASGQAVDLSAKERVSVELGY
ncbi:hypothetical protein J1N35_018831 [Gossypium stocksii]|uniref:Uncharacterized protein n=1 Tax=Gossypium stocksii TaxID=47602 RepID=A0A9D3VPT0_9ROSI|nr:hypothetical protein J1N35_018831 [Gossypium stocksii]